METKKVYVVQHLLLEVPVDVDPKTVWVEIHSATVTGTTVLHEKFSIPAKVDDYRTEGGEEAKELIDLWEEPTNYNGT